MKLIVGLGNIGRKYKNTRHNVGFIFVDNYATQNNLKFKLNKDFNAKIALTKINNENIVLMKPCTFMNLSGNAVVKVKKYYKIDNDDILIIQDDMDLDIGRCRFRLKGSSGGHNGLKSIFSCLGSTEIKRFKIGISAPNGEGVVDYVLGVFSKKEYQEIEGIVEESSAIINDFCTKDFETLMARYNK
ncbi:MAG: aminoacyl-tRNA hydrolase [Bacilli bacterium]